MRGPLKGSMFVLPEGEFWVGRQATNDLQLEDNAVSRRHCLFVRSGDNCTLKDLDSRNGTFVTGTPVSEQPLRPGDEIRIGGSLFCYQVDGSAPANHEQLSTAGSTRELRLEESLYLSSDEYTILPPSARALHDLRTLLRVSTMLHSFRGLHDTTSATAAEVLRSHLTSLLLDLIPASRAAIFIPGAPPGEWTPNPQVLARACDELVVVWLEEDERSDVSVLAAPLVVRGEVAAVVYLESADREHRFDEGHLQLLTAVAGMAAVAWENATILGWLQEENERLQSELKLEHGMVGASDKLRDLQRQITKVAPSNSTVLILGESGTGKELVARAVHRNSLRAAGPFVAINCAALTENLLESELFGHERGAFTGAITQKKGKLEVAEGGTVFLDEIGELSPLLQAKLLRVLQEREMERVGGTKTIQLDIRLVAATNRDLEQAVSKGDFRRDLFYRLNVVSLKAPALRERPEDTLPLAEHFAKKYAAECGRKIVGLAPEARAYLQSYSWPGNVRELENAIERAVVLGSADMLLAEDLPEHIRESRPAAVSASMYEEAVEAAKRQVVLQAFEQVNHDHEAAAKILGLHPNYLHKLIRTMNLKPALKRGKR
ncbi:MAG TPA: sigma 54-interacting transcriptional regulator [Bryobacteraceae bacterium]|nr:sigma 54-interacting transcriptional regulator [Bryobacteraceae bacterium]